MRLRYPPGREILTLALPALGALAADPLVYLGWGLPGVWWGIVTLMGVRAVTLGLRYAGLTGRAVP